MTGKLTVIPTPIGNLKDITLRALETLKGAELLLCEDTRHTALLLRHYEIEVPLLSYHKFNEKERSQRIIERIREGAKIGLVSDAGMPGISDPGEVLIRAVIDAGLHVEVLPGPNAAVTALVGSGLPTMSYLFLGFLSRDSRMRKKQWEKARESKETLVFYESPKRIHKTLEQLLQELGNRRVCIGRELTKLHEEYIRSDLETLLRDPEQVKEKGEMVLVVGPPEKVEAPDARGLLQEALATMPLSKAVRHVAKEYELPKNELYEIGLTLQGEENENGF